MQIEALITEARTRRLWLRSVDKPSICLHPDYIEKFVGVERLAGADYPNGWALADAREIAVRYKEHVV